MILREKKRNHNQPVCVSMIPSTGSANQNVAEGSACIPSPACVFDCRCSLPFLHACRASFLRGFRVQNIAPKYVPRKWRGLIDDIRRFRSSLVSMQQRYHERLQ